MKRGLEVVVTELREAYLKRDKYPQWKYQTPEMRVEYRALRQKIRQLEAEVQSYQPKLRLFDE